MVVSDLNIICFNQKNAEYSANERIKCDAIDINIKTPVTYSGWNILQGFKGIWYDVYPKDRIAENYQYDNEFFDIVCIKDTYIDTLNALKVKGNKLICIKKFKQDLIDLIKFYLKKSPIKRICFMARVQDEEVEAVLGTLKKDEFFSKLLNNELRFNVAYIVSSE